MKFSVKRDKKYLDDLKGNIEANYLIKINKMEEGSRGVDGETWILHTDNEKLFVKIDYSANNTHKFLKSLKAINFLNKNKIDYINELVLTKKNKTHITFNKKTLALFKFIHGEIDYQYPYLKIMELLLPIYKINPRGSKIKKEDFKINKLLKALDKNLEKSKEDKRLDKVIKKYESNIEDYINNLKKYYKLINKKGLKVITHSDACVNVMVGDTIKLIDWDDAMITPPERDCWFFMDYPEKIKDINKFFKKKKFDYELSKEMLLYYGYKMALIYLNDDLDKYLELKDKDILNDIKDIFEGWVNKKIEGLNDKNIS